MIRFILEVRRKTNRWLWDRGIGTLKQRYGFHNMKPIPYEKHTKSTQRGRYMLLGFCIGLTPYVVHMQGWLKWKDIH